MLSILSLLYSFILPSFIDALSHTVIMASSDHSALFLFFMLVAFHDTLDYVCISTMQRVPVMSCWSPESDSHQQMLFFTCLQNGLCLLPVLSASCYVEILPYWLVCFHFIISLFYLQSLFI